MNYLTGEIKKHILAIDNNRYHIEQLAKQMFDEALAVNDPATEQNVTKLTMLGNISRLCKLLKNKSEELETCLNIIEDVEKEVAHGIAKLTEGAGN